MNAAARASGIAWTDDFRPEEDVHLEGIEGLDETPPRSAVIGPSGRVYSSKTFGLLEISHAPRRWAIKLVEWAPFDAFILVTILANCATMAWNSPLDPPGTLKALFIAASEWGYLLIFTFEMLAKICAYGFIAHDGAYLRDPWCQLDFAVVSLAWAPVFFPSFGNYSTLRALRALRPLRALKRLPGMPALISTILAALPTLGDVALLFGLLFAVFGIFGLEQFKGELHYRCALPGFKEPLGHPELREQLPWVAVADEPLAHDEAIGKAHARSPWDGVGRLLRGNDEVRVGASIGTHPQSDFDTGVLCEPHESKSMCPTDQTCSYFDDNLNYGALSFDTFGWVCLQIFQTITFDGWTSTMYAVLHATGQPLVLVYFVLLIVLGGFFLVNLFLAVLVDEFVKAQAVEKVIAAARQARLSPARRLNAEARLSAEQAALASARYGRSRRSPQMVDQW